MYTLQLLLLISLMRWLFSEFALIHFISYFADSKLYQKCHIDLHLILLANDNFVISSFLGLDAVCNQVWFLLKISKFVEEPHNSNSKSRRKTLNFEKNLFSKRLLRCLTLHLIYRGKDWCSHSGGLRFPTDIKLRTFLPKRKEMMHTLNISALYFAYVVLPLYIGRCTLLELRNMNVYSPWTDVLHYSYHIAEV